MAFHPFEVNVPHLAYAFLGGFVVIFGLFSLFIKEKLYVGEAVVSTIVGIIIGPYVLNLLSPDDWGGHGSHITNEITLEVTRVVLAIGVFAIGVELPKQYMKRHWRSLAMLLGPAMVWGWLITALFVWAIFPGHDFVTSLAIAACVTPTDPILAQAVIGGKFADKHVPAHIRHLLSAESGSNDGAAFPFLYIAIYIILDADDRHAVGEWFYVTWLYEVVLGIIIGALLGFTVRKVMKFSERKGLIDRQSFVAQYVSLAVFTIGITTLLGSDDLLAAFACGTAFAWDGFFNKATEDSMFSNVIDLLFNCAGFIYIGAIIPFHAFQDSTTNITVWRLICFSLAVLGLRRLPIILAMYKWIPDIKTIREAAFVGWFGPMGVGAIFISTLARTQLPEPHEEGPIGQAELLSATIQPIVAFLVLASVLCHGLSIPFFSLTKRVHSITHTWSRQSVGDEPAWATHARRIRPGESIRINRDDDDGTEVVDDGTADRGDVPMTEKNSRDDSSGSSDQSPNREKPFEGGGGERAACEAMEDGTYVGGGGEKPRTEDDERVEEEDGRETPILAEYREGNHLVRERKRDGQDEVEVQVIRDYFHDSKPSEISSFWHPHPLKGREVDRLHEGIQDRGNAHYAAGEVKNGGKDKEDRLGLGLMGPAAQREEEAEEAEKCADDQQRQLNMAGGSKGDREAASHLAAAHKDKRDSMALKHFKSKSFQDDETRSGDGRQGTGSTGEDLGEAEGEDAFVDEPEEMVAGDGLTATDYAHGGDRNSSQSPDRGKAGARRRSNSKNVVYIHSRPTGRRRESIRLQVFAKNHPQGIIRTSSPSPSGSRLDGETEDGEAGPSTSAHSSRSSTQSSAGMLHPDSARHHNRGRPILSPKTSNLSERSADRHSSHRRDPSPTARAPNIRFAPDTAESSETAPGPRVTSGYYGKRKEPNNGLSMYRTSSIQSNASARSGRDRAEGSGEAEAPAGERYYKKPSGGGGLGMYRSKSVQDIEADERDVEAEAGAEDGGDEDGAEKSKKGGFLRRLRNR